MLKIKRLQRIINYIFHKKVDFPFVIEPDKTLEELKNEIKSITKNISERKTIIKNL